MKQEFIDRISGEIDSLRKTITAREKVLAKMLKDDGEPMRLENLKSTDLSCFLAAGIRVKFKRQGNDYFGELTACHKNKIILENVTGPYAGRSCYTVFNEETFWPVLRRMDDMTLDEVDAADAFDRLPGIVGREAHRIKWYCERGLDCFGWISKGLAVKVTI